VRAPGSNAVSIRGTFDANRISLPETVEKTVGAIALGGRWPARKAMIVSASVD